MTCFPSCFGRLRKLSQKSLRVHPCYFFLVQFPFCFFGVVIGTLCWQVSFLHCACFLAPTHCEVFQCGFLSPAFCVWLITSVSFGFLVAFPRFSLCAFSRMSSVTSITTTEQYESLVNQPPNIPDAPDGLVVHFGASWCQPCVELTKYFDEYQKKVPLHVVYCYVDVEAHGDICEKEKVDSVPHVLFFRRKRKADGSFAPAFDRAAEVSGAKFAEMEQNLRSLYNPRGARPCDFAQVDDYLKHLITRDRLVMFITGSPSRPVCGFTGRLMELMVNYGAGSKFLYFDIFGDDIVCEALKRYSKWPTYPQIYVDGELVGGFDIAMELHQSNQLKSTLKLL